MFGHYSKKDLSAPLKAGGKIPMRSTGIQSHLSREVLAILNKIKMKRHSLTTRGNRTELQDRFKHTR